MDTERTQRLAFLISGHANHCLAVAEAIRTGQLPGCEIAIVMCNIPGAEGAETTRAAGIQTVTLEGRGREQQDHEEAIDALLRRMRVDMVCLAGYLRVLSASFLRRWPGRVLNVHPSLLPSFPRTQAVGAALDFGMKVTGCTVHFVDETVDGGAIVEQRCVPIDADDTVSSLAPRMMAAESEAYIVALNRVLSGEYALEGRRYVPVRVLAEV